MALVKYDYTAADVQTEIDAGADIELEHDERRIVIEVPTGMLNMVLKAEDGVLMAPGHQAKLKDYVDIFKSNADGTKVLAYLRVQGSMLGTGIRGMRGTNIQALLGKIPSTMFDADDPYILTEYTEDYVRPIDIPDFDSMTWAEVKDWIRDNDNPDDYDLRKEADTRAALALKYN